MARQIIGNTRQAQRTAASKTNANFKELYDAETLITLDATTANTTFSVPAGYAIGTVAYANTTANAVTGGIKFGTTSGATDVIAAQAVAANGLGVVAGADILRRIFSTTAAQTIYVQPVTAWNGASLNLRITLRKLY